MKYIYTTKYTLMKFVIGSLCKPIITFMWQSDDSGDLEIQASCLTDHKSKRACRYFINHATMTGSALESPRTPAPLWLF